MRRGKLHGHFLLTSANTARTRDVWKRAQLGLSCARNSAEFSFNRTCATAADIALPRVRSAWSSAIQTMAASSNAHFATTAKKLACSRLAPKHVRPNPSNSESLNICGTQDGNDCENYTAAG